MNRIGLFTSLFVVFLVGICTYSFGQKTYTHAIGAVTENDSYLLMDKDGYYTNGLTLRYNWTDRDTSIKTIHGIEIGQYMYNAKNGGYKLLEEIDRPVTAYLFARYTHMSFVRENVFSWKLAAGTIGPNALGRQMQESIHGMLDMYRPQEWKFQLQNAFGIDVNLMYAPNWIPDGASVGFSPLFSSDIGMTFTNLKTGFIWTLGRKNKNSESSLWNARLNTLTLDQAESFFYFSPNVTYNIYNATVQGGLFNNSPFRQSLDRWIYQQKFGWQYAKKRFSLNLGIAYSGKEAKKQLFSQWWGSITINYNMK